MSEKRRGLGRGLGALIPSGPVTQSETAEKKDAVTSSPDPSEKKSPARAGQPDTKKTPAPQKTSASGNASTKDSSSAPKDTESGKETAKRKSVTTDGKKKTENQSASTTKTTATTKRSPRTARASGKTSAEGPIADVSRETSATQQKRDASQPKTPAAENQVQPKSGKSSARGRRDMGQALRSTTTVRRPVDMFFLPSETTESVQADGTEHESSSVSSETPEQTDESGEGRLAEASNVSRETLATPEGDVDTPTSKADGHRKSSPTSKGANDKVRSTSTEEEATAAGRPTTRTNGPKTENGIKESETSSAGEQSGVADAGAVDVSRETSPTQNSDENIQDLAMVPGAQFAEIAVADIHPNRKQPRQVFDEDELAELAFSVKELGVLQPVVVRPSREGEGAKYELVMGERRWRAVQKAGMDAIPAIIRETSDDDLLRDALLENLHRSQLNPLEEAAAYQQLLEEFGATQDELSQRIGRSRPQISNTLRLLRLPPLVQRRVAAGVLSSGHARALLGLTDPAEMERLAQRIVAEGMSVRATEETVALSDGLKRHATKRKTASHRHDDRLNYIADAFSDRLDTSVKIQLGARKGKMTIEFATVEDLNRIIDVLDPKMDDRG